MWTLAEEPEEAAALGSVHEQLHPCARLCGWAAYARVARHGRKPPAAPT